MVFLGFALRCDRVRAKALMAPHQLSRLGRAFGAAEAGGTDAEVISGPAGSVADRRRCVKESPQAVEGRPRNQSAPDRRSGHRHPLKLAVRSHDQIHKSSFRPSCEEVNPRRS